MYKSNYFEEIASAYRAEIDDLASDSQGRPVLDARLKEKRLELDLLLQMIEFAPEMVIPVLHLAFRFPQPRAILSVIQSEPEDDDFPTWNRFFTLLEIQPWASPFIDQILIYEGGDRFLVTAACVEYIRMHDATGDYVAPAAQESEDHEDTENLDSDQAHNPDETIEEWLNKNGFDSLDK